MSGTSNWKTIREKRVGDDQARVESARQAFLVELNLARLRKHRKVSQTDVARRLSVSQANVSQLERGDIKFSTLAGYVGALGGRLVMKAVFDDETVVLSSSEPVKANGGGKIAIAARDMPPDLIGQHEIAGTGKGVSRGAYRSRRRQTDGA